MTALFSSTCLVLWKVLLVTGLISVLIAWFVKLLEDQ